MSELYIWALLEGRQEPFITTLKSAGEFDTWVDEREHVASITNKTTGQRLDINRFLVLVVTPQTGKAE